MYNLKIFNVGFWLAVILLLGMAVFTTWRRSQEHSTFPSSEQFPLSVYYPLSSPIARVGEAFSPQVDIESQIRAIARYEGFKDADLLVRLAKAESSLNPLAQQKNGHSVDRGLFQWNNYWHPEISDQCSYSVSCSTRAVIEAIKAGYLEKWWGASLNRM